LFSRAARFATTVAFRLGVKRVVRTFLAGDGRDKSDAQATGVELAAWAFTGVVGIPTPIAGISLHTDKGALDH